MGIEERLRVAEQLPPSLPVCALAEPFCDHSRHEGVEADALGFGARSQSRVQALWNPLPPLSTGIGCCAWPGRRLAEFLEGEQVAFERVLSVADRLFGSLSVRDTARQVWKLDQISAALFFTKRTDLEGVIIQPQGVLHSVPSDLSISATRLSLAFE